jgi:uncharacterized membrane-anchored protein YitT (DUF2179 family)
MSPIIQSILSRYVPRNPKNNKTPFNKERLQKEINTVKIKLIQFLKESVLIITGFLLAGFGLKGFLLPNKFIDGGVTGISLLVAEVTGIALSVLLIIINLPFILIGFKQISRQFAVKSILAIIGLALAVHFIEYPLVTSDKLLVAAFGGFFLGAGIGLTVRGGGVLDGTEVLAIYISKKTGLTIGDVILIFNVIIFSVGAYVLSVEIALYAILTYYAAAKTVDFIIEGIEEYTGITIISDKSEVIRKMITEQLGHGATIYKGEKGFSPGGKELKPVDILYTVITRLEIARLQNEIDRIDPNAFVVKNNIKDTKGGMIKRLKIGNKRV